MAFSNDVIKGFLEHQAGSGGIISQELERKHQLRKTRLELTMLSRKMELEAEANRAQETFQDQLKRFSPEGSQFIAQEAGLEGLPPGQRLRDPEASALAGMAKTQNVIDARRTIRHGSINSVIKETDGIVREYPRLPDGSLGKGKIMGYGPTASKHIREAVGSAVATRNIISQARQVLSKTALSVEDSNALTRVFNGIALKYGNLMGTNPDAAVLIRGLESFGSMLARGTGETGQLSKSDVEFRIKTLPTPFNSAENAEALLNMMDDLVGSIEEGKVMAFSSSMGDLLGGVQQRKKEREARKTGQNLINNPPPPNDPNRQAVQQAIIQWQAERERKARGETE